jgi:hypothetical protein
MVIVFSKTLNQCKPEFNQLFVSFISIRSSTLEAKPFHLFGCALVKRTHKKMEMTLSHFRYKNERKQNFFNFNLQYLNI